MIRVIATGMNGSIGKALLNLTYDMNIELVEFSLPRHQYLEPYFEQLRQLVLGNNLKNKHSKTFFIHLAHPGACNSKRSYHIYRQNTLKLFQLCQEVNLPLFFASSASCFTENSTFYARFKRELEQSALRSGHSVIRFGIYAEFNSSNQTFLDLRKLALFLNKVGFKDLLFKIHFYHFNNNNLRFLLSMLTNCQASEPQLAQGTIKYIANRIPLSAAELLLGESLEGTRPRLIPKPITYVSCDLTRKWKSPKGLDPIINFLHGHKIQGDFLDVETC